MDRWVIITLLAIGLVFVIGSLLLRVRSGGKYEIKTIDLVFILIPLLLVAIATGKLKDLDFFGVKADWSGIWEKAAKAPIGSKPEPAGATVQDVAHVLNMASKGGVHEIDRLIQRKVEALEFRLGQGTYNGTAIKMYFDALYGSSYLRVVVVDEKDGSLFGVYNAADLISSMRVSGDDGYRRFQDMLNNGDGSAHAQLASLPGFLGVEHAVTPDTTKRDALASMEKLGTDALPMVDKNGKFTGTVERSRLTATLILAVTDTLAGR